MTTVKAKELGFVLNNKLELGDEYYASYSEELIEQLKEVGLQKIWGHEGSFNYYAVFRCDNPDHKDFGKLIVSIFVSSPCFENNLHKEPSQFGFYK